MSVYQTSQVVRVIWGELLSKIDRTRRIGGTQIIVAENPLPVEAQPAVTWVSEDEKASQMFEIFANDRFNSAVTVQKIRLSMSAWVIRNKTLGILKRVLDLGICLIALPLVAPIMVIAAVAIKLDSPGPILFKQPRVGKWGKPFICYKFRSMYVDAEARKAELMHLNEADAIVFKMTRDPRVTRVGRIIRKLSIDEIPQILNVIKGDMSWVGPRPPIPYEVDHYTYDYNRRLLTIPGITGLQQVSGRSTISFNRWVELDLQYIQEQSFTKDIEILIKTIPAVLTGKGAY